MRKLLIVLVLMVGLVNVFDLYEAVSKGEPVVFNRRVYMITGGENRGLTATEIYIR